MNGYSTYRRRRYLKLKSRLTRAIQRTGFLMRHQQLLKVLQRYARRLALPTLTTAALLGINAPQTWGQDFRVNSATNGDQEEPAVATSIQGNTVVVYQGEDIDRSGIYFQRYDVSGQAVGGETRVNQLQVDRQTNPDVALDDAGNFTVVWESANQDGSNTGVYGRRYDAAGVATSSEFLINTYTDNRQSAPKIAMDGAGDFTVVWRSVNQDGDGSGIYGQRFDAVGNAVDNEFLVNTYTTGSQLDPDIALDASGNFVVVWGSYGQDGSGASIYGQRFAAGGTTIGNEFRANSYTTGYQTSPAVAMNADGDFAVTWYGFGSNNSNSGVQVQRFNNLGNTVGGEFQVNTFTTLGFTSPTLAYDQADELLVAWKNNGQDGDGYGIYARRYDPIGNPLTTEEFKVNAYTTDAQEKPAVAADHNGKFIVAWESEGQDGSGRGVYAQRFFFGTGPEFHVNVYTSSSQNNPKVASDDDGNYVVVWESFGQDGDGDGIYGRRYDAAGNPLSNEFQINQYTLGSQISPSISSADNGNFVVVWESFGQDGDGSGVYGRRYNAAGNPLGNEFQINQYTTNFQFLPSISSASNGDFVVIWGSYQQDDGVSGVYGRRYNAAGSPLGNEFQIDQYTIGRPIPSSVSSASDGDFVVIWSSNEQDGDGYEVYGRRYSAVGSPLGNKFQINQYTTSSQFAPSVSSASNGDFVVVWNSEGQDGDGYGVYGRRYDTAGSPLGDEFQINRYITGNQVSFSVSLNNSGDFVIVWGSNGQDGSSSGVFGRRYDAAGNPIDNEFQINTFTINSQSAPSVASSTSGDFVIAWQSRDQDGDSYGIYAQPYQNKLPACPVNPLNLNGTQNTNLIYRTAATITSNQTIASTTEVQYRAAESITLNAGFSVQAGARFTATIEDCPNAQPLVPPSTSAFARTTEVTPRTIHPTELTVFPNPARQSFTFTVPETEVVKSVRLLNQLGQEVQQVDATQRELLVENLQRGMYYLVVQTEKGQLVKAVVKE